MKRSEAAEYGLFCGIDVGKAERCAVAQDGAELRALFGEVRPMGGALAAVDQFGSSGRLAVEDARGEGLDVAHVPPRKFKQAAGTYGEGESDAKGASIVADTARSQPRNIDPVPQRGEAAAELKALSAARGVAVRERARLYDRAHGMVGQARPALEQAFTKKKLRNDLETRLAAKHGGPAGFRKAGRARAPRRAASLKYHKASGPAKAGEVLEAMGRQSVGMPATEVIEAQVGKCAGRAIELEAEEDELDAEIARLAPLLPEVAILKSASGIGDVHAAVIAVEIGDISRFADASHLASYGGVAPVGETSGTSASKEKKRKGGNRRLKNALIQSAQRAVEHDEGARACYDRKRGEDGKGHRQALRALARRRVDLIYALLSNGTHYEPLHGAAS